MRHHELWFRQREAGSGAAVGGRGRPGRRGPRGAITTSGANLSATRLRRSRHVGRQCFESPAWPGFRPHSGQRRGARSGRTCPATPTPLPEGATAGRRRRSGIGRVLAPRCCRRRASTVSPTRRASAGSSPRAGAGAGQYPGVASRGASSPAAPPAGSRAPPASPSSRPTRPTSVRRDVSPPRRAAPAQHGHITRHGMNRSNVHPRSAGRRFGYADSVARSVGAAEPVRSAQMRRM